MRSGGPCRDPRWLGVAPVLAPWVSAMGGVQIAWHERIPACFCRGSTCRIMIVSCFAAATSFSVPTWPGGVLRGLPGCRDRPAAFVGWPGSSDPWCESTELTSILLIWPKRQRECAVTRQRHHQAREPRDVQPDRHPAGPPPRREGRECAKATGSESATPRPVYGHHRSGDGRRGDLPFGPHHQACVHRTEQTVTTRCTWWWSTTPPTTTRWRPKVRPLTSTWTSSPARPTTASPWPATRAWRASGG